MMGGCGGLSGMTDRGKAARLGRRALQKNRSATSGAGGMTSRPSASVNRREIPHSEDSVGNDVV